MFGTQWTRRRRKAEHAAEDAWESLRAAMDSAGDAAKSTRSRARSAAKNAKVAARTASKRTRVLAGDAQDRVGEARRRANAAKDALTGRRPRTPWQWLVGALFAGVVLGLAAATAGVRAIAAA